MKLPTNLTPEQLRELPIAERRAILNEWIKQSKRRTMIGSLIWTAVCILIIYLISLA